jgi:hypothetical protein
MGSAPTEADKWLASELSARLEEKVTSRQVEELRERGLLILRRPGRRTGKGGRMPGTYPRRMVGQGAEAIRQVRAMWNHDVAAAVMHLRGFDIAPSALRRLWLGTPKNPGLLKRLSDLAGQPDSDVVAAEATVSKSPIMRQTVRILGSRDRATMFIEYVLALLSTEEGAEKSPHPVLALALGIQSWEPPDVDYESASYAPDARPPEEVLDQTAEVRRLWHRLPELIQTATKTEWNEARDVARTELEIGNTCSELRRLLPRRTGRMALDAREILLSLVPSERTAISLVPLALGLDRNKRLAELSPQLAQARAVLLLARAMPNRLRAEFDAGLESEPQAEWFRRFAERRPKIVTAIPSG